MTGVGSYGRWSWRALVKAAPDRKDMKRGPLPCIGGSASTWVLHLSFGSRETQVGLLRRGKVVLVLATGYVTNKNGGKASSPDAWRD